MSLAHEMCEILRLVGSYRDYGNVITLDGTQIDARVTIVALNGATVSSFDSTSQPYTESNFFQPNLNITSVGGSATFRVDFFVGSQPVTLQNFYVNTYDLDGAHASASGRQFTELHRLCQLCVVVRNEGNYQGGSRFITTAGGNLNYAVGTNDFNTIRTRVYYTSASSVTVTSGDAGAIGAAYFGLDLPLATRSTTSLPIPPLPSSRAGRASPMPRTRQRTR